MRAFKDAIVQEVQAAEKAEMEAAIPEWKKLVVSKAKEQRIREKHKRMERCGTGLPCALGQYCVAPDKWQGLGMANRHDLHLGGLNTTADYQCSCPLLPSFGGSSAGVCRAMRPLPPNVPSYCLKPLLDSDVDDRGNPHFYLKTDGKACPPPPPPPLLAQRVVRRRLGRAPPTWRVAPTSSARRLRAPAASRARDAPRLCRY